MATPSLSACVTRILSLSGFPPELKTRDIQAAFSDFENERGGFKIKWIDDTSLLIVFNDPIVAKRAYLQTLLNPPTQFTSPTSATPALLKPYDGADAQTVIAAVNSRANGHRTRPSLSTSISSNANFAAAAATGGGIGTTSTPTPPGHARRQSSGWKKSAVPSTGVASAVDGANPFLAGLGQPTSPLAREPSPTLPNIPAHPTLSSLISSAHSDLSPGAAQETLVS